MSGGINNSNNSDNKNDREDVEGGSRSMIPCVALIIASVGVIAITYMKKRKIEL